MNDLRAIFRHPFCFSPLCVRLAGVMRGRPRSGDWGGGHRPRGVNGAGEIGARAGAEVASRQELDIGAASADAAGVILHPVSGPMLRKGPPAD